MTAHNAASRAPRYARGSTRGLLHHVTGHNCMTQFVPFSRQQAFLVPSDMRAWLPDDDAAHFVVAAVERVPFGAFEVRAAPGGKAQYYPRLLRRC